MTRRKTTPPRGVLSAGAADRRRFEHARYHPSPDLQETVEHYWSVRWQLRGLEPHRAETLPHPSVYLIFENGVGCIAGVTRGKFTRLLEGNGGVFGVKFWPGGFYPYVKAPLTAYTDSVVSLGTAWGREADALTEAVLAVESDETRIATIEDFLRRRRPEPDANVALVRQIVAAVASDRQLVKVENLVERFCLSKRTLQRLFARYVGVNPKWVIQRYRLHEAAEQLTTDASTTQTALAIGLGYADQAHFVRDFTAIVGTSPATYARRARQGA